jgi:hypothetical protein
MEKTQIHQHLIIKKKMLCRLALQYDGVQWPSKPLHFSKILSWTFDQSFSQIFLGLDNHDVSVLDLKMDQKHCQNFILSI